MALARAERGGARSEAAHHVRRRSRCGAGDRRRSGVGGAHHAVARIAIDTDRAAAESGESDHDWWQRAAPLLQRVFSADRYPLAARVGAAAGQAHDSAYSAGHAYDFGLARVLDGLAALIETSSG
ncbi:TetR/AcrR family transcriptional regulator C-terminal domain-containing protein [Nocardia sp. NBC_01388]|uniref:TetR/AcrR family transcriptional regulator C-terminal domain-containing protein n=1 Tax=Nocardia sp. NBC_01388 TaxID=2903596 RepID=UPI0038678077